MTDKISKLYDPIQPLANELIKRCKFGVWEAFITQGYRSEREQQYLYSKGRRGIKGERIVTHARPGYSFHNFGVALDIAFKNKDGYISWDIELFNKAGKIGKELGFEWGGDWWRFRDRPHFQYTQGLSIYQVRAGARPKINNTIDMHDEKLHKRLKGYMIIRAHANGEAYYVDMKSDRIVYMGKLTRTQAVIMQDRDNPIVLGVSEEDFDKIKTKVINN